MQINKEDIFEKLEMVITDMKYDRKSMNELDRIITTFDILRIEEAIKNLKTIEDINSNFNNLV